MNVDSAVVSLILCGVIILISVWNNIFRRRAVSAYKWLSTLDTNEFDKEDPECSTEKARINETILPMFARDIAFSLNLIVPILLTFAATGINIALASANITSVLLYVIISIGISGCIVASLMLLKRQNLIQNILSSYVMFLITKQLSELHEEENQ